MPATFCCQTSAVLKTLIFLYDQILERPASKKMAAIIHAALQKQVAFLKLSQGCRQLTGTEATLE